MKKIILIAITALLSACSTPQTTLKNDKTGEIVVCGGNRASSIVSTLTLQPIIFGKFGYYLQKSADRDCKNGYLVQEFRVIKRTGGTIGDG